MICACGNQNAYRMRYTASGESCNQCGGLSSVHNPDVFFKGAYRDPNLVDVYKPEQKDGVWIESRAQKAAIMKNLGVVEHGDKRHGCRLEDKFSIRKGRENRSQRGA